MREQGRLPRGGDTETINRNLPGKEIRASKGCQVEKCVAAKGRGTSVAADKKRWWEGDDEKGCLSSSLADHE